MKRYSLKSFLCLCLAVFGLLSLNAETFRVHKTVTAEMENQLSSVVVDLGVNDALALVLPKDKEFLKALEFEITIPQVAVYYQGAIAWSFYDLITPRPTKNEIDFSGNKLYLDTFPATLSYNFKIPLVKNHNLSSSPYTTILSQLYTKESELVFLRLQLAMKGTSDELYNAKFKVEVNPVLYDEGLLDLKLKCAKNISNDHKTIVYIDEKPIVEYRSGDELTPIRLATGTHHLSIVSDDYRSEVRTFTINQAKTSTLEICLRDIAPLISISAPVSAKTFLDDKQIELKEKEFAVLPGEHNIRFIIGDYELTKTLIAENGKTYVVTVSMDVNITEKN